ncbi:MAG: alpha/beta hydrolase [Spirosomataceae bacterium]
MNRNLLFIALICSNLTVKAQTVIPIYDGVIPNNKASVKASLDAEIKQPSNNKDDFVRLRNITMPSLTVYKPEKPNGTAVIICPGGGYYILAVSHEGFDVAKRFNQMGVTAFVLKYRLPTTPDLLENNEIGPLMDAQRAIQLVRSRAQEFGINPSKIGIMGFSAGGHLASTAATHFNKPVVTGATTSEVRPDFAVLGYPVVSFNASIAHMGSREALLGKDAPKEKVEYYSNELQVTPQTPPTFLVHATDDKAVPVENSIEFMLACKRNNVPVELHVYPKGGHGFGLNNKTTTDKWMDRVENWLKSIGM